MRSVATGERLVLGRVFGVWVQWGSSFPSLMLPMDLKWVFVINKGFLLASIICKL